MSQPRVGVLLVAVWGARDWISGQFSPEHLFDGAHCAGGRAWELERTLLPAAERGGVAMIGTWFTVHVDISSTGQPSLTFSQPIVREKENIPPLSPADASCTRDTHLIPALHADSALCVPNLHPEGPKP